MASPTERSEALIDLEPRRLVDAEAARRPHRVGNGRLAAWLTLAGLLAALAYLGGDYEPAADEAYRYSVAIYGIVAAAVMAALVLWITPGIRVRDVLALRRPQWPDALALRPPRAWPWALWASLAIVVATFAFDVLYEGAFGPFEADQGLATYWDGSRVPAFFLNFLVIAVLVPVSEELMYRGIGFAALARFGTWPAIGGTALLFGLAHGYVGLLPAFVVFGVAMGWLRARTGSVYPGMLAHGVFNGTVVVLAVAFG